MKKSVEDLLLDLKLGNAYPWPARAELVLSRMEAPLDRLTQALRDELTSAGQPAATALEMAFRVRREGPGHRYTSTAHELAALYSAILDFLEGLGWSWPQWLAHRADRLVRSMRTARVRMRPAQLRAQLKRSDWLLVELVEAVEREDDDGLEVSSDLLDAISCLRDEMESADAQLRRWEEAARNLGSGPASTRLSH